MSTLQEEVAELTGKTNELVQTFQNEHDRINGSVQAALSAVPNFLKTFYVDQINGDDNNDGGGADRALKTIQTAIYRTPHFGMCVVNLMSDYYVDDLINIGFRHFYIRSSVSHTKRRITFSSFNDNNDPNYSDYFRTLGPGFYPSFDCFNYIKLLDITLVATELAPEIINNGKGMIYANGFVHVQLERVEIELPENSTQNVFANNRTMSVNLTACTYPSDIAGRWITGVAAGTDPLSLRNVSAFNLTSL